MTDNNTIEASDLDNVYYLANLLDSFKVNVDKYLVNPESLYCKCLAKLQSGDTSDETICDAEDLLDSVTTIWESITDYNNRDFIRRVEKARDILIKAMEA